MYPDAILYDESCPLRLMRWAAPLYAASETAAIWHVRYEARRLVRTACVTTMSLIEYLPRAAPRHAGAARRVHGTIMMFQRGR